MASILSELSEFSFTLSHSFLQMYDVLARHKTSPTIKQLKELARCVSSENLTDLVQKEALPLLSCFKKQRN